jgi:carboxypeptidase PM20D1
LKVLKRLILTLAAIVLVLAAVVIVRTQLLTSAQEGVQPIQLPAIDKTAVAEHLSRAVQFKTISHQDPAQDDHEILAAFHDYLKQTFPNLHKTLTQESVADWSLLYTWKGSDPSLKPVLLMAHQDVVPVSPGTEDRWTEPPFSGVIADGFIWGRGSLDDKGNLLSIFEAIEMLVKEGFQPRRTLMVASGHDEEVGGTGARQTAALLAARGVALEYVLDEGGSLVQGMVPGVGVPVALVGVAEKGYVSIELAVSGEGGHSSMPPPHTAIGELSRALYRLELHPMPARFAGLAQEMLTQLAPAAAMPFRAVYANTWLFGPLLVSQLARAPTSNAMIRTTTAEDIVQGGVKDNVLPTGARAVVNFRILPGDTVASVTEHVRETIDDPGVTLTVPPDAHDPSLVSPTDTDDFRTLRQTIMQVFPEAAVVSPYLMLGATDSRSYQVVAQNIYRFSPVLATPADLERIHGTNERMSVDAYARSVAFFTQLIRNSTH